MEVKGYVIEDTGVKLSILEKQGAYKSLHSGEIVTVDLYKPVEIPVKDWDDLVYLKPKRFVSGYLNTDTELMITVEEYKSEELRLLASSKEEHGELIWNTLEDEFNYRKFKAIYTPMYKTVHEEVAVIVKNVKRVQIDTGNKFINPLFCVGYKYQDIDVYMYDRERSTADILTNKLKELGIKYAGEDVNLNTGDKKWTNSSHSGIRFAKIDNSYIFGSKFKGYTKHRGSLETLKSLYEEDLKEIGQLVDKKVKTLYGIADDTKTHLIKQLIKDVENSIYKLHDVIPYSKSEGEYSAVLNNLGKIEEKLVKMLKMDS